MFLFCFMGSQVEIDALGLSLEGAAQLVDRVLEP
jgi:hypothetical protein